MTGNRESEDAVMSVTPDQAQTVLAEADCLFTETQVEEALDVMAQRITGELGTANPIIMCVMNGGLVPTGKLVTRLAFPLQMDYLHATRYRNTTSGGDLTWLARPHTDIRGRSVLVVDDILDEGITLAEEPVKVDKVLNQIRFGSFADDASAEKAAGKAEEAGIPARVIAVN